MKRLTLALLLASCAPTRDSSHTQCNLILGGDWDGKPGAAYLTGEDLQDAEWRVIYALRKTHDPKLSDRDTVCRRLFGVKVLVASTRDFIHPWSNEKVTGYAACGSRTVVVNTPASKAWYHSSLAHELVHIAQDCTATWPIDPGLDVDHANWRRDGILDAINLVEDMEWIP